MHTRRPVVTLLTTLLTTALVVLPAGPSNAGPPPAGQGVAKVLARTCNSQDGSIDIGGTIRVQEFGQHRVTRLRVKWLLYDVDPSSAGIHNPLGWTQETAPFPNDARNFYHVFSYGWTGLAALPDDGYTLVAKVTWVRAHRRDWNRKLTVAYCS